MARIRALKPGFFKDHELFMAEKESGYPLRLAYEGLWCVADREGRFKWKPHEIKTDVLPYDDVDMAKVLDALVKCKKIIRYKCAGEDYGYIPKFAEHQHVNKNEANSTLPAPPKNSNARAKPVNARAPTVVAPSKHHEELVSGVREQERKEEDVDARATLDRICEILRVELQADPSRITWLRQVEEMLRDGIPEADILAGAEVARANAILKLPYVRAVAFRMRDAKAVGGEKNGRGTRESVQDAWLRTGAELAAEYATGDARGNHHSHNGAGPQLLAPGHARGGAEGIAPADGRRPVGKN